MINKLKLTLFALVSFIPFFAAIPTAIAASTGVVNAVYTDDTFMSKIGAVLRNIFSFGSGADAMNANKTASIADAIGSTSATVKPFGISNFRWGMIYGPEDANISFDYQSSPQADSGYNMAVFYFNQMPPTEFTYSAHEAVKSTSHVPYAVVGVDYVNCYSNDAETHKAVLFSADSSCTLPPAELDNSSILPNGSDEPNTIILPVGAIYNSDKTGPISESDYITIGLYDVDTEGNVTTVRNDTNKYYFEL